MKIYSIGNFKLNFTGKREDRKTVSQLKNNNSYDLNEINQRRISNAIDNLAKNSGEDNVKFLIDVSENLKYGTNIDLGKSGYNDWRVKLNNAAAQALALSSKDVQERYSEKINQLSNKKELTSEEKEILKLRKSILKKVDRNAIEKIKNDNIKNINNNLDYLIVSTEIPTAQKLYILKRLDYFMSPAYKINKQLENKKTQALAEIVNDIVVDTPESKIPNIKLINQRSMGCCAAISICRKALAYEDKPNFVDMVMSELDDSNYVQVYDISKLGSHTKVPINKIELDFDYALSKGYRIIDTSALYWMNIADTAGSANEFVGMYSSFDKRYFDTFTDSHMTPDLDDDKVEDQDYYRALLKSKNALQSYKKNEIKSKYISAQKISNQNARIESTEKYLNTLMEVFKKLNPNLSVSEIRRLISDVKSLEISHSSERTKIPTDKQEFVYLPVETESAKLAKVQKFLISKMPEISPEKIKKETPEIMSISDDLKALEAKSGKSYAAQQYNRMRKLYDAAASYRIQKEFSLEIPELRDSEMRRFNIPDRETLIIQNLDMLTKKLDEGTLKPELKEALVKSFGIENSDEALRDALVENKNSVEYALSEIMNTLYYNCLSVSKPNKLNTELKALREAIVDYNDKDVLDGLAKNLQVKNDKRKVLEILDKYIEKLSSEDCSEQEFIEIYNSVGKKNQMQDFKETYERLGNILFNGQEANPNIIAGFNLINELPQDAPIEQTLAVYQQIGDYFNQISLMTSSFQQALEIHNENGEILNTVSPKEIILKILEKKNEIVPVKNLKVFQDRIARVEKAKISSDGGSILLKDLPKELTTLTKPEKETLDIIEKNINKWYAQTTRSLEKQYRLMKPTLGELHRNLGIKKGLYWVHTDGVSGLNSRQQVRIFEYMTDRPYYTEENIRAAVKKIKKSPYSGISSTSVNDKEMAMHAQYIVDIAPVEVTTSNGKETKEALFHDNTWGPAEQDNTWKDETGLLRTDYDDKLGGKRGYITNDKYRNGLLLENIYNSTGSYTEDYIDSKRYKKLTKVKTPTTFDFPMFSDVIVPGRDPKASSNLRSIREHLFISPTKFFSQLEEDAQKMTKAEIQSLISKTADDGTAVVNKYTEIVNRVKGDDILNSGINTKEDYDKLSDTDELKILFEKIALTKSYNQIANDKIFYRKTSLAELSDIRKEIAIEARKNFDYVFGKNIDIAKYGFESIQDEVYDLLDDFQKTTHVKITPSNMAKIASSLEKIRSKYGADSLSEDVDDLLEDLKKTVPVKITPSKKFKIANSLGKINKDGFDGSLDKTIDLMTNNFMQTLAANTVGFENKDAKIKELGNKINAMLHGKMDFNIKDLNAMSNGDDFSQNIVKWIDDMYDPVTDEEFVKIFRRIQNMSKEEFNNTFGAKITDELTGIKNISGYDILKKFKMADEKTQDLVFSTLYNEEMGYQIRMSKIVPQYGYGKLEKTLQGYVYKDDKRSFDEIYLDYYYSLLTINLHKKYDKLKDEAFLKYQLFPAIPQLDVEDPEESLNMFRRLYTGISDSVEQINNIKECEKAYNTLDKLTAYLNKFDDDKILTPAQQRYVNSKITEFLKVADKDDTIKQSIEVANTILQLSNGIDAQTYRELLGVINDELNQYRPAAGKTFEDNIQAQIKDINDKKRSFIMNVIDPKYEKDAYELLNKWISAKIKNLEDEEFLFEDFENFYKKHGILKSPEKMLNEYLLLLAKPSPEDKKIVQKSDEQIKQLENVKEVYKSNLTSMLILSNLLSLQYVLMRCAKEGNLNIVRDEFKKSKIELNNGTVIPLDSEQGLHTVMSEILVDKDLDTAIMFLEQLGLCEEYIDLVNSNDKFFDKAYKSAKRIFNIYGALDRQTKIINEEIEKLGDLNNDPNYLGKIDMLQERILDRCKNTHYRKSLSLIEPAITDIKNSLQNNPAYNKVEFIKSYVQSIRDGSLMIAEKDLETPKSVLEQYQTVYDLVEKIKLPLNSPYEEKRKEFIEKYEKLNEFVSSKRKSYTNINISTL